MKKKLSKLLLFVIASIAFTACSKDDSATGVASGNLIGNWEYFQEGSIVNGQEILLPYEHAVGCLKDNIELLEGGVYKEYYYDNFNKPCDLNLATGTWTRGGDVITISALGLSNKVEILSLDATTLKVKYVLFGDTIIEVYKRVAN